jgi:hypothetical protein
MGMAAKISAASLEGTTGPTSCGAPSVTVRAVKSARELRPKLLMLGTQLLGIGSILTAIDDLTIVASQAPGSSQCGVRRLALTENSGYIRRYGLVLIMAIAVVG